MATRPVGVSTTNDVKLRLSFTGRLAPGAEKQYALLLPFSVLLGYTAYIKIAEGCDHPCSFSVF